MAPPAVAAPGAEGINRIALSVLLSLLSDNLHKDQNPQNPSKHHWTYSGPEGPDSWPKHYEHCRGSRQSPIDIDTKYCVYDPDLGPFYLDRFTDTSGGRGPVTLNITNNGHAASCKVSSQMRVRGGGLPGAFKTAEFHFHWGSSDQVGSEHALDGRKFPLEMHIVNYAEKYKDIATAMKAKDGLAVLGVFFEVSERDNPEFSVLDQALKHVRKAGSYNMVDNLRLRALLPDDISQYWRYQGSLTTPGCYESVTWTVFRQPKKISRKQLETLRGLYFEEGHNHAKPGHHGTPQGHHDNIQHKGANLVDNWRPLQPRNERLVRRSFKLPKDWNKAASSPPRVAMFRSVQPSARVQDSQAPTAEPESVETISMLRSRIQTLERLVTDHGIAIPYSALGTAFAKPATTALFSKLVAQPPQTEKLPITPRANIVSSGINRIRNPSTPNAVPAQKLAPTAASPQASGVYQSPHTSRNTNNRQPLQPSWQARAAQQVLQNRAMQSSLLNRMPPVIRQQQNLYETFRQSQIRFQNAKNQQNDIFKQLAQRNRVGDNIILSGASRIPRIRNVNAVGSPGSNGQGMRSASNTQQQHRNPMANQIFRMPFSNNQAPQGTNNKLGETSGVYLHRLQEPVRIKKPYYDQMYNVPNWQRLAASMSSPSQQQPGAPSPGLQQHQLLSLSQGGGEGLTELV